MKCKICKQTFNPEYDYNESLIALSYFTNVNDLCKQCNSDFMIALINFAGKYEKE